MDWLSSGGQLGSLAWLKFVQVSEVRRTFNKAAVLVKLQVGAVR